MSIDRWLAQEAARRPPDAGFYPEGWEVEPARPPEPARQVFEGEWSAWGSRSTDPIAPAPLPRPNTGFRWSEDWPVAVGIAVAVLGIVLALLFGGGDPIVARPWRW